MKPTTRGLAIAFASLAACLTLGCVAPSDSSADSKPTVRLALLGQALVEHDPRGSVEMPLSSVTPILDAADAVFTNLEVAVAGSGWNCVPTRDDVYFHGAGPEVLDFLKEIGVTLLSLSNNHSWDYGTQGILSTIAEADARGLIHAGTGSNIAAASAPAYLDLGDFRLGLVSMATVKSPEQAGATDHRAGINRLDPGDSAAWERNIAAVRSADDLADGVIVYQHFQAPAEEGWQESWARATIDAGADIYVSHGVPTLKGVEVYNGGLILYGLGNFIFHTRTKLGKYPADVWQSVIVEVTLGPEGVEKATFTPLAIDEGREGPRFLETRGHPEVAKGELAHSILNRLVDLSLPYGTSIKIEDGRAELGISEAR